MMVDGLPYLTYLSYNKDQEEHHSLGEAVFFQQQQQRPTIDHMCSLGLKRLADAKDRSLRLLDKNISTREQLQHETDEWLKGALD